MRATMTKLLPVAALLSACGLPATRLSAADIQWNVASGDWATGTNWNPAQGAGGPTGVNTPRVNNGGTVTISGSINSITETGNSFTIGGSVGGLLGGTVIQSAGTLSGLGDAYIGVNTAPGTYVMSGGTVQFNSAGKILRIGSTNNASFPSGAGTFLNGNGVSAGTVNAALISLGNNTSATSIGATSTGYFLNQGTVNLGAGTFNIGSNERPSSTGQGRGTLAMEGGSVTAGIIRLGTNNASHGTVVQTGGTVTSTAGLGIGSHVSTTAPSSGAGTYLLSGGTVNVVGGTTALNVGRFGQGLLDVSGTGRINADGPFRVGYQTGGHGTMLLSAGTVLVSGLVSVSSTDGGSNNLGADLTGVVTQTGGLFQTQNSTADVYIGVKNPADATAFRVKGTYNITGGTLQVNGNRLSLGGTTSNSANGEGTLSISGANTLVAAPQVNIYDPSSGVTLGGGTLRTNGLRNDGGTFTWGAAKITRYHTFGASIDNGATDFSTSSTQTTVRYGTLVDVTGTTPNLATSSGSQLELGNLYLSLGTRQDLFSVAGSLDLSASGDLLSALGNVYYLRGAQFGTQEYGSIPLVYANNITGTFDTFLGGIDDGRGFTLLPTQIGGAVINPSTLANDTGLLQYADTVSNPLGLPAGTYDILYFHYKVSASVPEPATFLTLLGSLGVLRISRRLRDLSRRISP